MKEVDAWERQIIDEAAAGDRTALFALADQVRAAAPARRWNTLVVDGGRGQLVGEFLLHTLQIGTGFRAENAPGLVTVANSRQIANWGYRRQHRQSARELLTQEGVTGATLLVTDMVDRGICMRRLSKYARSLDLEPDYAVLCTPHTGRKLRGMIGAPRRAEVYSITSNVEPYLAGDTITQGMGLYTARGNARMQPHPHHWNWLEEPIRDKYHALADEYIHDLLEQQRLEIQG